ncbi:hypothetical protein INT43_009105, partial [Umbelopsis isabellina]
MSISSLNSTNILSNHTVPSTNGANSTTSYISQDGSTIITVGNGSTIIRPNINTQNLTEIKVGILLPFSQTQDNFTREIVWGGTSAIRMAANEINKQGAIPGAYITLIEKDSYPTTGLDQAAVTNAVYAAVTLLQQGVVGVIGDVSSSWTSLSALMTGTLQIPQCSFSASAISLSDKSQYKYFFRTIPTQIIFADTMLAYVAKQGWSKVSILYSDDALGQQLCEEAIIKAGLMDIHVVTYQAFYKNGVQSDLTSTITNFTQSGARIIIVAAVGDAQNAIMVQAASMGYLNSNYVWLLIGAVGSDLEDAVDDYNGDLTQRIQNGTASTPNVASAIASASDPMMVEALQATNLSLIDFNRTFTGVVLFDTWLTPDGYPPYESFLDRWAALDPTDYPYAGVRNITTNEGLAYSCMWTMADGFNLTLSNATNSSVALSQLATGQLGQYMTPLAFNVGYVGPEGPMIFDSNGDVTQSNFLIYNMQWGQQVVIGNSVSGNMTLTARPMYAGGSYNKPADSPPSMALNPSISSPAGMVIFIISAAGILFAFGTMLLVIIFRKHHVFKASSPIFCCLELIGFMLTYANVILMIGVPTTITCYVSPIVFNLGFVLVLGNMVAKNFRIYRIFNNIFITRTVITDIQLIKASGGIVAASMLIAGISLVVAPPTPTAVVVSSTQYYWSCDTTSSAKVPFQALEATFSALLVAFATFLAYKTRLVGVNYSKYNECRQIGFSVYNIMFSAMIGFIVTVNTMLDYFTRFYITVVTILWGCSVSFLILFLPKLHEFFKRKRNENIHHHMSPTGSSNDVETKHSNGHGQAMTSGFQLHGNLDSVPDGELISLDQILASEPPMLARHRKGSLGSTFVDENGKTTGSFVEAHEGKMPMRRVFRYFPFLAQWDMLHIMVFPWSGYFSYFSAKSSRGSIFAYTHTSVISCDPGNYVFKVHGVGWYDAYIQVHDRESLDTWRSWFDRRHDSGTLFNSSSFLALGRGSAAVAGGLQDITIEECDDSDVTNTHALESGISHQHLLDRRPSENTLGSSLAGSTESGGQSSGGYLTVLSHKTRSVLNKSSTFPLAEQSTSLMNGLDDDITFAFEGYGDQSSHTSSTTTQHPLERVAAELRQNARSSPRRMVPQESDDSRRRGSE